ncbi:alpha/beta-hydrolase [Macrolepiota fuliginosa MF-IS2]|uniref:Carboxylic ester hydrolase n=1 Tax=Macrolepiota fuliginosa MF-IS2 TaxID=1400762 RepID=A0A9P5XMQ4_9AGAR|nr:alpha/beta-hydrolase [Macrolepiota fuliginosa MF-IS2]
MFFQLLVALVFSAVLAVAAPAASTAKLDDATITGKSVGSVQQFLGIPFAQPPVGDLRFRLPQPIPTYNQSFSATAFGPGCPQQKFVLPVLEGLPQVIVDDLFNRVYSAVFPSSEGCLTINVVKPASATLSSKLPVLVWIYGGGFEFGGTSMYDGTGIVARSIDIGSPVIFVSMNYRRLTGFGFLASKEVREAGIGNLGLQDQRQALRWVQKYIAAFGGDPTKVTIWGESAGAVSVSLHMLTNGGDTEGLFRAGVMQSGAPVPVGDIENGQIYYDSIVADTGCSGSADTLQCLRTVPYDTLKMAIDNTPSIFAYQSLHLAWPPRADGVFLTDHPQRLVQQGKIARVPFITGELCNCDDEGTLFSLSSLNVTTEGEFKDYFKNTFLPGTTDAQVDQLATLYPDDITQGSPFDTGILNAVTPQFKRIAAVQGDGALQAPRRLFLENTSGKQDIWVYLSKRFKILPLVGSLHASDLINSFFLGQELQDYIIRFTVKLDPSGTGLLDFKWPKYTTGNPNQLIFLDGLIPQVVGKDTYRQPQMDFLTQLSLQVPI